MNINIDENSNSVIKVVQMIVKRNPMMARSIISSFREKQEKRIECGNWDFSEEDLSYEKQIESINNYINNGYIIDKSNTENINYTKTMIRQIERKIYGYKQQDIEKNKFNDGKFINIINVIDKMYECSLLCYYCNCKMAILYTIVREGCQWTVDRIDNDYGHNNDNFVLACLDCNLKRRCRSSDKYLFTKQLNIVKTENENQETIS